jgi:hypothetical protein
MKNVPKLIVTSKAALMQKYGKDFTAVHSILRTIVQADAKRHLKTTIVYIDDAASVKKVGIRRVTTMTRKACKEVIDTLYKKMNPNYIMIFGAQDIFPFQELLNPVANRSKDPDTHIPSDLPYACDAPYSTSVSGFTGPTRVVGRVPDIPGVADLNYVKAVTNVITQPKKPGASSAYASYFAITAAVWKKSTRESLSNIFGNSTSLRESPPTKTPFTKAQVKNLSHFFNCHGTKMEPFYYGEPNNYPIAFASKDIDQKVLRGTVATAECCYGSQLYDPANSEYDDLSIANTYMRNKVVGFVGSSNIAYGPAEGQGLADLITQYWLRSVVDGATTGRALLEARQKFLNDNGPDLDPYEQKTLAQFDLLGDPSLKVVEAPPSPAAKESIDNRRINLFNKGVELKASMRPSKMVKSAPHAKGKAQQEIKSLLHTYGFTGNETETKYKVPVRGNAPRSFTKSHTGSLEVNFRTFVKKDSHTSKSKAKNANVIDIEVLVVKESGNQVLGHRVYVTK